MIGVGDTSIRLMGSYGTRNNKRFVWMFCLKVIKYLFAGVFSMDTFAGFMFFATLFASIESHSLFSSGVNSPSI
jgi:hypothetical protein